MKKNHKGQNESLEATNSQPETKRPDYGYVYIVKNPSLNEFSTCASEKPLKRGAHVISPTRYGLDYSVVVAPARTNNSYEPGSTHIHGACVHFEHDSDTDSHSCPHSAITQEGEEEAILIKEDADWIERVATKEDYERYLELLSMEDEALILCREKIQEHNLEMKLVAAHYLFGDPKIIFFFTAANRVDFRELVKDLVSIFRIRIELRQIGVRDESRLLGGLAVCGRDFCCHGITDKMNPVSIKMAKEQNLSLNSTKISGPCGRLLCCLSYEYDFYNEEKKRYPSEGSRLKIQNELMRVTEVNILSKTLSLSGQQGRYLTIPLSSVAYNNDNSRWEIDQTFIDEFLSL